MELKSLVYNPIVDGQFYHNESADSIISRICLFVCFVGWLVGQSVVTRPFGWLAGWFVVWFVDQLVSWLVGLFAGWLVGHLVHPSVSQSAG
jgi:hypothetical protein